MRIAAHQPHSFPWLGYLHKVAHCDVFVVMDDLQFEAQNFQNRNQVKVNNGVSWLTIPVVKGSQSDRICDKRIAESTNPKEHWQRRNWQTLRTHYGRAPFFQDHSSELEVLFTKPWERLLDFNLEMLRLCMRWLDITTPVLLASTLELEGQKTERILNLCQRLRAHSYYAGRGGSTSYLDVDTLTQGGVQVEWQDFNHPTYPQRYPELGFIKNLAALDYFFNCGRGRPWDVAADMQPECHL